MIVKRMFWMGKTGGWGFWRRVGGGFHEPGKHLRRSLAWPALLLLAITQLCAGGVSVEGPV
jgi:hypothetical protein